MDGIMNSIRDLLSEGMASRRIIDLGFAPRTVYKVQRDFGRKSAAERRVDPNIAAALQQGFEQLKVKVEALEAKVTEDEPQDPCPMCGQDVGWSKLPTRRSLIAPLLEHGHYRRCPMCHKERQVPV